MPHGFRTCLYGGTQRAGLESLTPGVLFGAEFGGASTHREDRHEFSFTVFGEGGG